MNHYTGEKGKVYIIGPYSIGNQMVNVKRAIELADKLLALNYVPIVPHLTHFWHKESAKPYATWLAYDRHLLLMCDYYIRLPGESYGGDREEAIAKTNGITQLFLKEVNNEP